MKKYLILFVVLSFVWLVFYRNKKSEFSSAKIDYSKDFSTVEKLDKELEFIEEKLRFVFPWNKENKVTYEKPVYESEIVYAEVISDPEWSHLWEVSRRFDEDTQQRFAKIKWYSHYFAFWDFGVKIWVEDAYSDDFTSKNPELFRRYFSDDYDVLYNVWGFYVQKFEKNINQDFDIDYLQYHNGFTWCFFDLYDYGSHDWDFLKMQWKYMVYKLGSLNWIVCDLNWNNVVYFVYKPDNNYYYKLSWQDWCAPSCGIPTYFEIL